MSAAPAEKRSAKNHLAFDQTQDHHKSALNTRRTDLCHHCSCLKHNQEHHAEDDKASYQIH